MVLVELTDKEVSHLEEVLHGDLDQYYGDELNGIIDNDFKEWKSLSNSILGKCNIPIWEEFDLDDS